MTDEPSPRFVPHYPLKGRISTLVAHDTSLVALGTVGSGDTQLKFILYDIDVRRPLAVRTQASRTFGGDWTWSIVSEALSFNPASYRVALPFTAWRQADTRYVSGARLADLRPRGGQIASALPVEG